LEVCWNWLTLKRRILAFATNNLINSIKHTVENINMRNSLFSLILFFSILAVACTGKHSNSNDTKSVEDTTEKKSEAISEKIASDSQKTITTIKPKVNRIVRDTIKIDLENQSDYKIKVGQLISCRLYQFSSTGLNTEFSIDNDEVLSLSRNKREFTNPSKSEMPDGGKGHSNVVFEATKAGICNLVIREMYRGNLRKALKYKIIVE